MQSTIQLVLEPFTKKYYLWGISQNFDLKPGASKSDAWSVKNNDFFFKLRWNYLIMEAW